MAHILKSRRFRQIQVVLEPVKNRICPIACQLIPDLIKLTLKINHQTHKLAHVQFWGARVLQGKERLAAEM